MTMPKQAKRRSLRLRLVALCVGAILIVLLLSLSIFLLLINNVMGQYVKNNMEFTINETSNNLAVKTAMLEDILLRIRSDEILLAALQGHGLTSTQTERTATAEALDKKADLYSNKNIDSISVPYVELVYLFDNNGVFNCSSYTDYLLSQQNEIDAEYKELWKQFVQKGNDVSIVSTQTHINVIYTVYSKWMEPLGTAIFAINKNAITAIMNKSSYTDAFWALLDKQGAIVMSSENNAILPSEIKELSYMRNGDTYEQSLSTGKHLLHTQFLSMGLQCVIGVPSNQLSRLLFTAVTPYLIVTVVLIVIIGLALFAKILRLTKPLAEIADNLQQVADKNFSVKLPEYPSREYNTISNTFNMMTDTINHLIVDVYEKKLMAMDSEMQMLQSQINPHFMYNVLHSIALKAQMDGNDDVQKMISNFAGLTRARLAHKGNDKIPIKQELQYVQFYLDLQLMRFDDKLTYSVNVQDDALLQALIPRLTLEMITENAVVHGIEPKDGSGKIYIDISSHQRGILIIIEDNGVGFDNQDGEVALPLPEKQDLGYTHNHIALNNCYKLLQYYYGSEYGITIRTRRNVGTIVEILIPKEEGNALDKGNDC